jgi:hypothetical protein
MPHTKVPLSKCPVCKYEMDCATCVEKEDWVPKAGDGTICIKCGEFLLFTEGLGLRLPTEEEYQKYGTDPRIIAAQVVVRGFAGRPDHLKWPQ